MPPQAQTAIQNFLDLSDERIQEFLNALKKAESKFNTNDLAVEVSNTAKMPRPLAEGIVQVLAGLYLMREQDSISLETFLDKTVEPGVKNILVPPPKDKVDVSAAQRAEEIKDRWTRFRSFLMATLALDETLGTAAKTGPVMTEHEKIFQSARVLTDIRPIFHTDLSQKPNAAVIVHMLRLTTRDIFGAEHAQYFALDTNDIRFMKHLMERAIKKEETLKNLMSSSGVSTIEPKGFF